MSWRWFLWSAYAIAWTVSLLVPVPVHPGDDPAAREGLFLFSKAVHISAYAVFTALTGWLAVRGRARWLMLGVLSLHALGTEGLQYLMDLGRVGCWSDVGIDHIGIALGLAWSLKCWRSP